MSVPGKAFAILNLPGRRLVQLDEAIATFEACSKYWWINRLKKSGA
jgi:hypothetical protein